jgi:serine/threonine protein kinase
MDMDLALLIPIIGMLAGTVMLAILIAPLVLWMRYKHQLAKEKIAAEAKDPEAEKKLGRVTERLENLEALMCRLDTEINAQLERSLSMGRIVTGSTADGVSQMPTTFMSVVSALEGRYQVLKEIGRGGMGIVFQAYDKQLKEQVAIKILSPMLSNDGDALERLKREVSAARRITHSNVIRIHDIAEVNGLHFVSMEFFGGTNLKEYIKQAGHLSIMEAFNIASQVCDGLQAAHAQGVIHRDLKSQNIIIGAANQIKIIDFGLAYTQQMQGMTATGLIMGTPEYMAPEQVSGKKVDERADVYSLGIILYELFTGRVPFTGQSAISVGFQQMKDPPPRPTSVNPQIPLEVEQVILKALQKDPMHRHRSVAELKEELDNAVRQPVHSTARQTASSQVQLERSSE